MKTLLIILLTFSFNLLAKKINPALDESELNNFIGPTKSLLAKQESRYPTHALVKVGDCLKLKKDGEEYWTDKETIILRVDKLGKKTMKMNQIRFISDKNNKWFADSTPKILRYEKQVFFNVVKCPPAYDELTPEEIVKVLEYLESKKKK